MFHTSLGHRSKQLNITIQHNYLTIELLIILTSKKIDFFKDFMSILSVFYVLVINLLSSTVNKTGMITPSGVNFFNH